MNDIRCANCAKKLAEGHYAWLVIKCPRCGALNTLRAASPESERQRAPNPGDHHGSREPDRSLAGRQTSPGR
ncbi:Com family DNA-binding transcriptional regulator [Andreprevotia chitinilytica]|uniref:Com family DNA-binding transcriptional regulator n=1 Tax=Andreprevotia chitinilytica TaxID=396808 RepID=UPI0009FEDD0D|nr:Com family DNA-binding transcriptional regulator [Andreprevotia chitinilytica]